MKRFLLPLFLMTGACTTLTKPFLYEANLYSNRVYILGTVHGGVPMNDVPADVLKKFDDSKNIIAEIDPERAELKENFRQQWTREEIEIGALLQDVQKTNPGFAKGLSQKLGIAIPTAPLILADPPLKLSQRLTPKAFALTQNYVGSMDLNLVEKISPGSASRFVIETQSREVMINKKKAQSFDPKFSLDLNLLSRATASGKYIAQLDDDEVLSPHCRDLIDSKEIVDSFEKSTEQKLNELDLLIDDYRSGSEERILRFTAEHGDGLNVCILDERNQKWVPEIIKETERAGMYGSPPAFTLVGAAHLFGPQGILELLRRAGYTVRRVQD